MRIMQFASGRGEGTARSLACGLIDIVGREDFGPRLLRLVRESLHADLMSCMVFSGQVPALIGHDTLAERRAEAQAMRGYLSGCYRDDPNTRVLFDDLGPGDTLAVYMSKTDVPTLSYRRRCYDQGRIVDRLSVLHKTARGDGITVNFYRSEPNGPFQEPELDLFAEMAPMLRTASVRHCELLAARAPVNFERALTRLAERFPSLTHRQAQCAAGAIVGLTADELALELGIKPTSVITHRKHAYDRLGVSGQHQLIGLFHAAA